MADALRFDSSPSRRRQLQLLDLVVTRGAQHVEDLASELGVSSMTVYRDLAVLEAEHLVERHRGEVTAANSSLSEFASVLRIGRNAREKQAISDAAIKLIRPGQAVLLDDSTTLVPLTQHLRTVTPLTVVSNAAIVMRELAGVTGITLISTGGEYVPWADGYVGTLSEATLASLRLDVALTGVSAVNDGWGMHSDPRFVGIKTAMVKNAAYNVLVVDHSKFSRSGLYRVMPLTAYDHVITDNGCDSDAIAQLEASGVTYEVVAPQAQEIITHM